MALSSHMSRHIRAVASLSRLIPPRHGRVRKRYVLLIVLLLLLVWAGWLVVRAVNAKPGEMVDYGQQLLDIAAEMQPQGENGWPIMAEAIEQIHGMAMPDLPDWPTDRAASETIRRLTRVLEGPYDPKRLRFELAYLDQIHNSGVLELLDDFAAHPRCVREAWQVDGDQGLLFVLLPELASVRNAARARAVAMRVAAERGNTDELVRAWRHIVSLARAMSYDPTFISHLVGLAVIANGCEELNRIMVEHDLDEATCRQLLAVMDERPILAPMSTVLERERISQYDTIQRTHSDDGHGDGILLFNRLAEYSAYSGSGGPGRIANHPISNIVGLVFPSRAETTRTLDEYFDAAEEQADMPRVQRQSHPVDLDLFADTLPRLQLLLQATLPAISNAISNNDMGVTTIESTRVLLAIEAFEAKHARLPATLGELSPEFLAAIPEDAVACQPFVFVLHQPGEEDPRTFWLYSTGADGVDNGGTEPHAAKRATIALRSNPDGVGFDYIFNRLREPYSDLPEDLGIPEDNEPVEDLPSGAPPTDSEGA